jgi:hypothetical protein
MCSFGAGLAIQLSCSALGGGKGCWVHFLKLSFAPGCAVQGPVSLGITGPAQHHRADQYATGHSLVFGISAQNCSLRTPHIPKLGGG